MGLPADDEVVARAREEPAAFGVLFERYVDAVFRYCFRRLGERQAAEDATSVVFERAWSRLGSYRSGSFRAWLFTIAHHAVVDDLRGRRSEETLDFLDSVPSEELSPEEWALGDEAVMTVRRALAALSREQWQVVELHLAGLSGPEIGLVLGKPSGAVRAAKARATARLRELLDDDKRERKSNGLG